MSANPRPKTGNPGFKIRPASWLILTLSLAAIAWAGLYYLVTNIHPTARTRLTFLALWGLALLSTAWPVLLAVNQRWSRSASVGRVWRQSFWVAAFGSLAAWLQMSRALTLALAATLAAAFILLEALLMMREKREEAGDGAAK